MEDSQPILAYQSPREGSARWRFALGALLVLPAIVSIFWQRHRYGTPIHWIYEVFHRPDFTNSVQHLLYALPFLLPLAVAYLLLSGWRSAPCSRATRSTLIGLSALSWAISMFFAGAAASPWRHGNRWIAWSAIGMAAGAVPMLMALRRRLMPPDWTIVVLCSAYCAQAVLHLLIELAWYGVTREMQALAAAIAGMAGCAVLAIVGGRKVGPEM